MKKYIYKVAVVLSLMTLISCDKDLEQINIDPTRPLTVPTTGLFVNANKVLLESTRGGFSSGRMALPWIQYSAQRNYTPEDRYQIRTDVNKSLYTNLWLTIKDYKTILDIVDDPAQLAKVQSWGDVDNQRSAARIMIAYAQLQLVDMYGDLPYYSYGSPEDNDFQAMTSGTDKEINAPVFAPQVKIYADLMKELKEAAENINLGGTTFSSGDQIFGTAIKMQRFANSLRLRIATRVKNVPELTAIAQNHINEAIEGGVMLSNDDSVTLQFQKDMINPAPMYRAAFIDNRNDFAPTNTFVNLLKGEVGPFNQVDPRLYAMVAPMSNLGSKRDDEGKEELDKDGKPILIEVNVLFKPISGKGYLPSIEKNDYVARDASFYAGMPIGLADNLTAVQRTKASQFSYEVYRPDYKMVIMEYSEVEFLLAEAKGWSQDNYVKGVKASLDRWNVSSSDAEAYLNQLAPANEETVLTQKYISLYMIPYEAWAEYRRTKFPKTLLLPGQTHKLNIALDNGTDSYKFESLVPDVSTDLPERITYSDDLNLVNKDNKDAAAARMGGDKMSTKLIWASK